MQTKHMIYIIIAVIVFYYMSQCKCNMITEQYADSTDPPFGVNEGRKIDNDRVAYCSPQFDGPDSFQTKYKAYSDCINNYKLTPEQQMQLDNYKAASTRVTNGFARNCDKRCVEFDDCVDYFTNKPNSPNLYDDTQLRNNTNPTAVDTDPLICNTPHYQNIYADYRTKNGL